MLVWSQSRDPTFKSRSKLNIKETSPFPLNCIYISMKGYMYILLCSDNSYYTGSTKNLGFRLEQHQTGNGANYTRKRLPVELVYFEIFSRIGEAYRREKQVQGWSKKKKMLLISGCLDELKKAAKCLNSTSSENMKRDNLPSTPLGEHHDSAE